MLLNEFKDVVDSSFKTMKSDDLEGACRQLGIDTTYSYSVAQVVSKMQNNIRELLSIDLSRDSNFISVQEFLNLRTELVYRYVLYDDDPLLYLAVLQAIQDALNATNTKLKDFSNTLEWRATVQNARNLDEFSHGRLTLSLEELRNDYPRDFDVATSAKLLKSMGCKIEIISGKLRIESLDTALHELERMIKEVGGISIIHHLFHYIFCMGLYSEQFERYYICRRPSWLGFDQKPDIPFGFLLNLSLKHLPPGITELSTPLFKEIIELTRSIVNVYDVQFYEIWPLDFQTGDTILSFISDIVLWDAMFSVPQCRPTTALDICENLFKSFPDQDFIDVLGFTLEEFMSVAKELLAPIVDFHSPTIILLSDIISKLSTIDASKIEKILNSMSHLGRINENYLSPHDYSAIDFGFKPLVKINNEAYVLLNRVWCSANFFEVLAMAMRPFYEKIDEGYLDNKLGVIMEDYLIMKLAERGVSSKSGKFKSGEIVGECDLVIETETSIILIELKKKPLTRKAKSGVDTSLIIDLAKGVLDPLVQTGKAELILKRDGKLVLTDRKGLTHTVEYKAKSIERVAVTQFEYGGFHDKTVLAQFLNSLLTHSYKTSSKDRNVIKGMYQLEAGRMELVNQFNEIQVLDGKAPKLPFINYYFLSLPQILELLAKSSDNVTFLHNLTISKFMSSSTFDWYVEFENALKTKSTKV